MNRRFVNSTLVLLTTINNFTNIWIFKKMIDTNWIAASVFSGFIQTKIPIIEEKNNSFVEMKFTHPLFDVCYHTSPILNSKCIWLVSKLNSTRNKLAQMNSYSTMNLKKKVKIELNIISNNNLEKSFHFYFLTKKNEILEIISLNHIISVTWFSTQQ